MVSFVTFAVLLVIIINIEESDSVPVMKKTTTKSRQQMYKTGGNADYEPANEILNKTNIFVKNFDYYVGPTTHDPKKTTPAAGAAQSPIDSRSNGKGGAVAGQQKKSSSMTLIIVIVAVVAVVLVIASVGIFVVMRSTKKTGKRRHVGQKGSVMSLGSIKTVASDTGKPIDGSGGKSTKAKGKK